MKQHILIIRVLFSSIPLLVVNFGNRYRVLANSIRHRHNEVMRDNISPTDVERFLLQIKRLRDRLRLMGSIRSCAAIAFVFALAAMIAAYFGHLGLVSWLFRPRVNFSSDGVYAAFHAQNPNCQNSTRCPSF